MTFLPSELPVADAIAACEDTERVSDSREVESGARSIGFRPLSLPALPRVDRKLLQGRTDDIPAIDGKEFDEDH